MQRYFAHKRCCAMTAEVLADAGVQPTGNRLASWDLYIPSYGGGFSTEIADLLPSRSDQWVAGIPGSWRLTNKQMLWIGLCAAYGRQRAAQLSPESWWLEAARDRAALVEQHREGSHYILKNPILQRRTGLRLTQDLSVLLAGPEQGYTLAQRLLPELVLLHRHRFNLRLYLLLTRQDGRLEFWLHRRGRCVCAPAPFSGDLMDAEAVISRSVGSDVLADGLPFSLSEAVHHLPRPQITLARLDTVLCRVLMACRPGLQSAWCLSSNPAYQLLGVDVTISNTGGVRIIEMNAGPDLRPHCSRDHALKYRIVRDLFEHISLLPQTRPSGFRRLDVRAP